MLRTRTLTYLLALALGTSAVFTATSALDGRTAEAAKKKKKKVKKAKKPAAPIKLNDDQKKARTELMGSFKFGMTKDEVIDALSKQMDDHYAELIKETEDIATQDRLRKEKAKEVKRVKKSYVEFTGEKSGWDVSIIDEQFKHGTDESMLEYWENQGGKNQRRFFFFHDGALYKMFIQVDTNQFEGDSMDFDTFAAGMKARYGAKIWDVNDQTDITGEGGEIGVRLLDKSRFYDAYCLIVFDMKLAKEVAQVRKERIHDEKEDNVILNSVRDDGTGTPSLNDNKDAVQGAIKGDKDKKKKDPDDKN